MAAVDPVALQIQFGAANMARLDMECGERRRRAGIFFTPTQTR